MATIFFFQVVMEKNYYWNSSPGPSNRPRQQIKSHPTSWQFPLISYPDAFITLKYKLENERSFEVH